jgi:hypothetical protein
MTGHDTNLENIQKCDVCGASWYIEWKCQIICPNCGSKQDCSDLFLDYEKIQRVRQAHPLATENPPANLDEGTSP